MARIVMLGGDGRSRELYTIIRREHPEHEVVSHGLWEKEADVDFAKRAELCILPFPSFRGDPPRTPMMQGMLGYTLEELGLLLNPGTLVAAGLQKSQAKACAAYPQLRWVNLMERESYQLRNAALTAEGAAALVSLASGTALWGSRVLLAGYGRIGRYLAGILRAFQAHVTVIARRESVREEVRQDGWDAIAVEEIPDGIAQADVVINTVPYPIFTPEHLKRMSRGARYVELASPPYGTDPARAKELRVSYAAYPGIPGAQYPRSAAQILYDELRGLIQSL